MPIYLAHYATKAIKCNSVTHSYDVLYNDTFKNLNFV